MHTKFNSSRSGSKDTTNKTSSNSDSLQVLKTVLLTTNKRKKYIVTLKAITSGTNVSGQISPKSEDQTTNMNEVHVVKAKFIIDTKDIAKAAILEKNEEKSDNSKSFLEDKNYDIFRLNGGWELRFKRRRKKEDKSERKLNATTAKMNVETEIQKQQKTSLSGEREKQEDEKLTRTRSSKAEAKKIQDLRNLVNKTHSFAQISNLNHKPATTDCSALSSNDKQLTLPDLHNHSQDTTSNDMPKASFSENLVQETDPILQTQLLSFPYAKDFFPQIEQSRLHTEYDKMDTNCSATKSTSDFSCVLPTDEEVCQRLEDLEQQVDLIYLEIKNLQKDLMPADDLAKFNILSRHFYEVDKVLQELKMNCSKLKNFEKAQAYTNENEELITHESYQTTTDIPFYENEDSLRVWPHIYLSACNCEVCKTSQLLPNEGESYELCSLQNHACKCLQANKSFLYSPTAFSGSSVYNIGKYNNMSEAECNCTKYHRKLLQESSVEHEMQQAQPNNIDHMTDNEISLHNMYKKLPEITCKSHLAKDIIRITMLPLRSEEKQLIITTANKSPINNILSLENERLTSDNNKNMQSSMSTECQGSLREPRKVLSNSPHNRKFKTSKKANVNPYNSTLASLPKHNNNNRGRHFAGNDANTREANTNLFNIENVLLQDYLLHNMRPISNEKLPFAAHHLIQAISEILGSLNSDNIALTVFLESNNLYSINVSVMQTGQYLGCVHTTEAAFKQAKENKLFEKFFIFFVLNPNNSLKERNRVFGHSFEFIDIRI